MKLFDRIFNKKPIVKALKRSYFKGAQLSRMTLDWVVSLLSADKELRYDLDKLRARARELQRNSPVIRQYLNLLGTNVIGPHGIRLQVQLKRGQLPNKPANDAVEAAWLAWCKRASTCGRYSLTQLAKLIVDTVAVDGEALVHLARVPLDNNKFGFALKVIDIDCLDTHYNVEPSNYRGGRQNEIRMGVELDEWERPVAYHIFTRHPSEGGNRERIRIEASELLHIYSPDRATATRGVSWLNSVMMPLRNLEGYIEAELIAARTASAKMGWLKFTDAASMHLAENFESGDGESLIPTSPLQFDASPGSVEMLPPGVEFQSWDPSHPAGAFESFVKGALRQVAAGLGVSYNALANDLEGVNYSSLRSGLLIERDQWRALQRFFIERLYQPVFEAWLDNAVLAGQLTVSPANMAMLPEAVNWVPRGWMWVDPLREMQAAAMGIQQGLMSRTQALAESGSDFELVIEQLAAEKALIEASGVVVGDSAAILAAVQAQVMADQQNNSDA